MCRSASSFRAVASKVRMNSRPTIFRFCSGSVTPGQRAEELVLGVDHLEADTGRGDEVLLDLLRLAGPLQTVVDVHTGQLVADRLVHKGCGDRGVDAAGQRAEHLLVADLLADQLDLLLHDVRGGPVALAARDVVEEVLEHRLAGLRVQHLRVPLHTGEPPVHVLERRDRRALGGSQYGEAGGRRVDRVTVRHPDVEVLGDPGQQRARRAHRHRRPAELAQPGPADLAAERLRHRLEPVADPERRHPGLEQPGLDPRRALCVHRLRPAGQHDRLRVPGQHLLDRHRVRHDLGVHLGLADPARDQLRVLRPEVDNQNQLMLTHPQSLSVQVSRAVIRGPQRLVAALLSRTGHGPNARRYTPRIWSCLPTELQRMTCALDERTRECRGPAGVHRRAFRRSCNGETCLRLHTRV